MELEDDGLPLSAKCYGQIDLQLRQRFLIVEVLKMYPRLLFDLQCSQRRCGNCFSGLKKDGAI